MTKLEIIKEVATSYTSGTRAVNANTKFCVIQNAEGRCCGIGRFFHTPSDFLNSKGPDMYNKVQREQALRPDARGHCGVYWSDIQWLHDLQAHWTSDGLSEQGLAYIAKSFSGVEGIKELVTELRAALNKAV